MPSTCAARNSLAAFADPASDYFLDRAGYTSDAEYQEAIHDELEDRDYFTEKNVFWVPPLARWKTIRCAALVSLLCMIRRSFTVSRRR